MRRRAGLALVAFAAAEAWGHGMGQRYDLPLPLVLYLCGAALTVVVSCVMLVVFVPSVSSRRLYPRVDLLARAPWLGRPGWLAALRAVAVAIYFLLLFAGFAGNPNPFRNIVPITVWAVWWVGMGYACALVVDLWALASPLETLFAAAERAYSRLTRGGRLSRELPLPAWVGAWPAVVSYLVFLGMETIWEGSDSPRGIAIAMLAYSAWTWLCMGIFGRAQWLEHGEVFARVFGLLSRFAPFGVRLEERRVASVELRPYAVGLLQREPIAVSETVLVITILSAVSFDGFLETPAWAALAEAFAGGGEPGASVRVAGLIGAPLFFLAIYLVFCRLIAFWGSAPAERAAPGRTFRIAGLFALTLVPIAIAYQVAHYLSFLAMAGQYMIPLVSDPLGRGWNLFGTANYLVSVAVIDARVIWVASLCAIVAGHVASLYLGHLLALREFPDRRAAVRSQGPMLVVMVAYTMLSLWIIAQPIVSSR